MRVTHQTLLEQTHITDCELANRKTLLNFSREDEALLVDCHTIVVERVDELVRNFYDIQTNIPEIALLIGDSETLMRLHETQRDYLVDLFAGSYDLDYVNRRLRLGLVHKRIGLEPKYYVAALQLLFHLLRDVIRAAGFDDRRTERTLAALDKLKAFDETLFVEGHIRSLVSDFDALRKRGDDYARNLEVALRERTHQLEDMARIDPLTGLINRRHLADALAQALRAAQRRGEPISLAFFDVDDLQLINDTRGHHGGDEILRTVGHTMGALSRAADLCFRYGGDEFCVILPNCAEAEAMNLYCARLQSRLAELLPEVSLSVGICSTGPDTFLDPDELISRADTRMVEAKYAARSAQGHAMPDDSAIDLRRMIQRGGTG